MRKKRISLLLVFAMLLSMLPVSAVTEAEDWATASAEDFREYKVTLDTGLVLTVGENKDITAVKIKNTGATADDPYTLNMDAQGYKLVTVYANGQDTNPTKIELTGPGAKYYDVEIGTGPKKLISIEDNSGTYEGTIDLAYGIDLDTDVTENSPVEVSLALVGKALGKDGTYKSIVCNQEHATGSTTAYKITADTTDTVGTTEGLKAYVVEKTNASGIEQKVAALTRNMTEAQVKTKLGLADSVENVDYHNDEDTLVVVKYMDGRVAKAGSTAIHIDAPAAGPEETEAQKHTLTISGNTSVAVGANLTLTASLVPDDATDATYKWSGYTNNLELLTGENDTGKELKVKGKSTGTATVTVTVTFSDNSELTKTVEIEVTDGGQSTPTVTLSETALNLKMGGTPGTLTATVEPDTDKFEWKIDEAGKAFIDLEGATTKTVTVKAKGVGTATVTFTVSYEVNGEPKTESKTCTVTVDPAETERANIDLTVTINGETKKLAGEDDTYTWTIGNQTADTTIDVPIAYNVEDDTKVTYELTKATSTVKNKAIAKVAVPAEGAESTPTEVKIKVTDKAISSNSKTYTLIIKATSEATYTISGTVYELGNDTKKIDGATITYQKEGEAAKTATAENGEYSIPNLLGGTYTLTAEADGYVTSDPIEVSVTDENVTQDFALAKKSEPIDPTVPQLTKLFANGVEPESFGDDMTVNLPASTNQSEPVTMRVYAIADDVTVSGATKKGNGEAADGSYWDFEVTVESGKPKTLRITATKGEKESPLYIVVINVPKPTGPSVTKATLTLESMDTTEEKLVVKLKSDVSFNPDTGSEKTKWNYYGDQVDPDFTLSDVTVDGQYATLTFSGKSKNETLKIYADADAFDGGLSNDSNELSISISYDEDNVLFTIRVVGKDNETIVLRDAKVVVRNPFGTEARSTKNEDGSYTFTLKKDTDYKAEVSAAMYFAATDVPVQPDVEEGTVQTIKLDPVQATASPGVVTQDMDGETVSVAPVGDNDLKLPTSTEQLGDNEPITAVITIENSAMVTLKKAHADTLANSELVKETVFELGDKAVNIPSKAFSSVISQITGDMELGVEFEELNSIDVEVSEGKQLEVASAVNVSLYAVDGNHRGDPLKVSGLSGDKRIIFTLDPNGASEGDDLANWELLYVKGTNNAEKMQKEDCLTLLNNTAKVAMTHLSTVGLVKVTEENKAFLATLPTEKVTVTYEGVVYDKEDLDVGTRTPISDAAVKLSQDGTVVHEGETDENGEFSITGVEAGTYTLSFEKAGYRTEPTEQKIGASIGYTEYTMERGTYSVSIKVLEMDDETAVTDPVKITVEGNPNYKFAADKEHPGVYTCPGMKSGEYTIAVETLNRDPNQSGSNRLIITEDIPATAAKPISLSEAHALDSIYSRGVGNGKLQVQYTGIPGVRYLALIYEKKTTPAGVAYENNIFNLYTGTVDTVIDASQSANISIWKIQNANKRITYGGALGITPIVTGGVDIQTAFGTTPAGRPRNYKKFTIEKTEESTWKEITEEAP